jgi:Tol biopolymer transport system component
LAPLAAYSSFKSRFFGFLLSNMSQHEGELRIDADRGDRLESWKEIAAYLGRGVATAQRWEQQEGLPVHRLPHAKKGSVFAFKSELDAWRNARVELGRGSAEAVDPPSTDAADSQGKRPRFAQVGRGASFAAITIVSIAIAAVMLRGSRQTIADPRAAIERSIAPRPLANDAAAEGCPSLSPDGARVVYHLSSASNTALSGLYIKPVPDGHPRRLATGAAGTLADCGYPKWSPAGDRIAFLTRADADAKALWVISPDGGEARQLTSVSGIGLCWAPDGQSIGFADRNSTGEPFSIFSIALRAGRRKRLTTPPLGTFGDTYCAFSPDGGRLAVVRYASRSQSDLFAVDLETADGQLERFTTGFIGMEGIDWSPRGSEIVAGSNQGLWTISLSPPRRGPIKVAAFQGGASLPTFSRRASSPIRLAYESRMRDANIWRWDMIQHQAKLMAPSTWWEDFPAVGPDGRRLAFASNRTGTNEIWAVNADGSDLRQVTFHRGPVVTSPQWSPDGQLIAFSSQVGGNRDIYVIRPNGSQSNRITTMPSEERNPRWSRDGRWIYFSSDQDGISQIWKAPLEGGTPVRVTTGEALEGFESPDGRLFYFIRSADSRGVWSVPSGGGRETFVLPDIREGYWGVADKGIYFLAPIPGSGSDSTTLRFFDFASRRVSVLVAPPGQWEYLSYGFSVSRDGRFVFWTRIDNVIDDLMLIDPWKP